VVPGGSASAWAPLIRWLAAASLVVVVAGCNILFPGSAFDSGSGFDPGFPDPSVVATFTTGSATIRLGDGSTVTLDRLQPGSAQITTIGSAVGWSSGDGWTLRLVGAGSSDTFGGSSFVELDRIVDLQHWTTYDPSRCTVSVEQATGSGLRGTASCKGLRWVDALAMDFGPEPSDLGQPPFDAEITFSATP
jgi:hypothetical protein